VGVRTVVTKQNILHYLIQRGIVTPDDLLRARTRVVCMESRNQVFRVSRPNRTDLILKQPKATTTAGGATQWVEAIVYWLSSKGGLDALAPILPRFVDFDFARGVLLLEAVDRSVNLHELPTGRQMPDWVHATAARLLSTLHVDVSQRLWRDPARHFFHARPPWITSIAEPSFSVNTRSPLATKLINRLRNDSFVRNVLGQFRSTYEAESLIHGDVKWPNILATDLSTPKPQLLLIDWEMVSLGDPLWDTAGFAASMVVFCRRQGVAMRPPLVEFWSAYVDATRLIVARAEALLHRWIVLTGIRLLQTCFEVASELPGEEKTVADLFAVAHGFITAPTRALARPA
jgi:hypothetical protein